MLCTIPVEILYEIVKLVDVKNIIPLSKTSTYLYNFYKENDKDILYKCLQPIIAASKVDINKLKNMYLIKTNKYRIALNISDILILDTKDNVHVVDNYLISNRRYIKI